MLPGHIAVPYVTDKHIEGSSDSSLAQHPSVHFPGTEEKRVCYRPLIRISLHPIKLHLK